MMCRIAIVASVPLLAWANVVLTDGGELFHAAAVCENTEATCDEEKPQRDCDSEYCQDAPVDGTECTAWFGKRDIKGVSWPLYASYGVAALMAFGIGGNDAANSLATTVGSGALSLQRAVLMGALGEFLGATFLGAGVSGTIGKGVADLESPQCWACGYCNSQMDNYQFGMIAALFGAAMFLLGVTLFALPVSTTHSVVGGVVGMTIAGVGTDCLNWSFEDGLMRIASGWVVSPLLSGAVGSITYIFTYFAIMKRPSPKDAAIALIPWFYAVTIAVMVLLTLIKSRATKELDDIWKYLAGVASFFLVLGVAYVYIVPQLREEVENAEQTLAEQAEKAERSRQGSVSSVASAIFEPLVAATAKAASRSSNVELVESADRGTASASAKVGTDSKEASPVAEDAEGASAMRATGLQLFSAFDPNKEQSVAKLVFKNLLVLTAFLETFAHGANDTANATGPLTAVQFAYDEGIKSCGNGSSPTWLMAFAGAFVGLGVITMGHRVIKAIGSDLAIIDVHIGFCVEFASAVTVVIASIMEVPVSTTHCQVGAVVFVAATAYGPANVAWSMFGKIAITWIATLPAAGGVAWLVTRVYVGV